MQLMAFVEVLFWCSTVLIGVGCIKLSLGAFAQLLISFSSRISFLGSMWLFSGFYFAYVFSPGGQVNPSNLMSVDDPFGG